LAEQSSFLEVAYLLYRGELPTRQKLEMWTEGVRMHTIIHENIKKFIEGFRYDAHPMGIFAGTVAALSTFYPESKHIFDPEVRRIAFYRLVAKVPTIAAFAYRYSIGMPYAYPDNELSYAGNFLNMMFATPGIKYKPNPALERAMDILFILHADHEQNCSTSTMRMGWQRPDRSVHVAGGSRGGTLRPAARRRQRSGALHAARNRFQGPHPGLHQAREGRRGEADGLRPPRLQELRPARPHHQARRSEVFEVTARTR